MLSPYGVIRLAPDARDDTSLYGDTGGRTGGQQMTARPVTRQWLDYPGPRPRARRPTRRRTPGSRLATATPPRSMRGMRSRGPGSAAGLAARPPPSPDTGTRLAAPSTHA